MTKSLSVPVVAGMFLLIASPVASDIDFSHRLHLKEVGASCVDCHNSVRVSTAASDFNLPKEENCIVCHDGQKVPNVDTRALSSWQTNDRTFHFNHSFHLKLGNVAPILAAAIDGGTYLGKTDHIRHYLGTENPCQACHRGLENTDFSTEFNLPQMSDCLVCHSEIDNPYSCQKCHIEGANLKPDNHTVGFADLHATGRLNMDTLTCLPCHGRDFTCKGCH